MQILGSKKKVKGIFFFSSKNSVNLIASSGRNHSRLRCTDDERTEILSKSIRSESRRSRKKDRWINQSKIWSTLIAILKEFDFILRIHFPLIKPINQIIFSPSLILLCYWFWNTNVFRLASQWDRFSLKTRPWRILSSSSIAT